jgi:hypothetical protein
MRPPASSNAWQQFEVLVWRRVCALLDAFSCHPFDVFELDVRYSCRKGHGIATIGTEWKVEHKDLLELWLCQSTSLSNTRSYSLDPLDYELGLPTYSKRCVQDVPQAFIFQVFERISRYQHLVDPNIEPRP